MKGLNPLNDAKIIRITPEADECLTLVCSLADMGRSAITDVAIKYFAKRFAENDSELLNMLADTLYKMPMFDRITDTFEKVENEQRQSS